MNTCLPCYVFPVQFMKYSHAILPFKFIKPISSAIIMLHIAHPSEFTLKCIFGHRGIISIVHNSLLIIYVAGRTEPTG